MNGEVLYYLKLEGQPSTFDEAVEVLGKIIPPEMIESIIKERDHVIVAGDLHSLWGTSLENKFSLWMEGSQLVMDMTRRFGSKKPYDMASLILKEFMRRLIPNRYERVIREVSEPSPMKAESNQPPQRHTP